MTDGYDGLEDQEKEKAKKSLKSYEKKYKDYATFGVAFDLKHVTVLPTDSDKMQKVKTLLAEYLKIREDVFEHHGLGKKEISAQDLAWNEGIHNSAMNMRNGGTLELEGESAPYYDSRELLLEEEREKMGKAYDKLRSQVRSFLDDTHKYLNVARGRARYRQVEELERRLIKDDARFAISKSKRAVRNSLDNSYHEVRAYDMDRDIFDRFANYFMPTWQRSLYLGDKIDLEYLAYRERRREERAKGTTPGYYRRSIRWLKSFFRLRRLNIARGYNNIGGWVDRTLGAATMVAANTLELGGKAFKLPLLLFSGIFNGVSYLANSKKRWNVPFSLRDNWKSVDDGRKIYRRYLKGACVLPVAVIEGITRGLWTLFGHKFKSGIFKRTRKWSGDILNDAKKVVRSMGISLENKPLQRRMYLDQRRAGYIDSDGTLKEGIWDEGDAQSEAALKDDEAIGTDLDFTDQDLQSVSENTAQEERKPKPEEEVNQEVKKEGNPEQEVEEENSEQAVEEGKPEQAVEEGSPEQVGESKHEVQNQEVQNQEVQEQPRQVQNVVPDIEILHPTQKKVEREKTLYRLFSKREMDFLKNAELQTLTRKQLTDLKDLLINNMSEFGGIDKKQLSELPLDQLIQIAEEDFTDQAHFQNCFKQAVKELDEILESEAKMELLEALSCSKEQEEDKAESELFAMREYALLFLKKNQAAKFSPDKVLKAYSPSELVSLSKNAMFFIENDKDGQDEETVEKLRDAAVDILSVITGFSITKFMMRPMDELRGMVQKALLSLDDRKSFEKEIRVSLEKEETEYREKLRSFDVETEIINDREEELLKGDYADASSLELIRLRNITERVLLKKTGLSKEDVDLLPLDFKVRLAREVYSSKDSKEALKQHVQIQIASFLILNSLAEIQEKLDVEYSVEKEEEKKPEEEKKEPTEAELNAKRDLYVLALVKAGITGNATRRDYDRIPMEELREAASYAVMIANAVPSKMEEGELRDYRETLSGFLDGFLGLKAEELFLLPTCMLEGYAKRLITLHTGTVGEDAIVPVAEPLAESYITQRIKELSGDLFTKNDFEKRYLQEAQLEMKELIAYRVCKETNVDRDALMRLDATSLYNFYTEGNWETAENVTTLLDLQKHQTSELALTRKGKGLPQVERVVTQWSNDEQRLLDFLSDLTSGIGVTDSFGNALQKEVRVLEIFRKNKKVIAELEKGRKNLFKEIIKNVTEDEAKLFIALQKEVNLLLNALSKQKEENEDLRDTGWNETTVEALLNTKESKELFQGADDRIFNRIEEDGSKVQELIKEATKNIFVDQGEEKEETEEPDDYMPPLFMLGEYDRDKIRRERNEESEFLEEGDQEPESVKELHQMRDSVYGKDSLQGRYIQALLAGYYEKSSTQSKRLMLSELLRNIKPAHRKTSEDYISSKANPVYLMAVLKGAGPVLQKLVQGIPEKKVKFGYRRAIQVAKSELRNLPEEYVQARLDEIAKGSKKKVKSIKKLSNLGAASVAEALLCKVDYADGTSEQVVVKLLRPDVEERMKEETGILTSIAAEADQTGFMEGSILSHIEEIKKELDFRTEVANAEKGKSYVTSTVKDGTVKTVQVNKNFEAKKDSFVMNKAEGESCDRYLVRVREETKAELAVFANTVFGDSDKLVMTKDNSHAWLTVRNRLIEQLNRLEARKKHVIKLSEKWVQEALYGNLFHHGDLHSGNLMVDDDGITVLDYGNANVFSDEQITLIIRMMASAMGQNTKLFIDNLQELINLEKPKEERKPIPEREKLEKILQKVFSLGNAENAGERILVALQKAEEVGVRMPHVIQNFSRCEQRLENTINEFNTAVNEVKRAIKRVELMEVEGARVYMDPLMNFQHAQNRNWHSEATDPIAKHIGEYKTLDEKTLTDLLDKDRKKFVTTFLEGILLDYEKMNTENTSKVRENLKKEVEKIREKAKEAMATEDDYERVSKISEISFMISDLIGKLGDPFILTSSDIGTKLAFALDNRQAEKVQELLKLFDDVEWIVKLKKNYDNAYGWLRMFKKKSQENFIKDFLDYSEHSKEKQVPMTELRNMIADDLNYEIDYVTPINSIFNAFRSNPEYLDKDEKGKFLIGETAKELEDILKKGEYYKKIGEKGYKMTPKDEENAKELRRLKFYVSLKFNMDRKDAQIREQLKKVFDDGTAFGASLKKKYEDYRELQVKHHLLRSAKKRNEEEIQTVEEERKKAMDSFLAEYRQYLVRELESVRNQELEIPKVKNMNFAVIMGKIIMSNRIKSALYLGPNAKSYFTGDMKLSEKEEEQLEKTLKKGR